MTWLPEAVQILSLLCLSLMWRGASPGIEHLIKEQPHTHTRGDILVSSNITLKNFQGI